MTSKRPVQFETVLQFLTTTTLRIVVNAIILNSFSASKLHLDVTDDLRDIIEILKQIIPIFILNFKV